jgi:hypothetical protein
MAKRTKPMQLPHGQARSGKRLCLSLSALLPSLLGAALLAAPRQAHAHGGSLPLAQQILVRNGEMLVGTPYWGIFLGREGGEWRWICDEAINMNPQPRLALGSDGQTLYANDLIGLTYSTDGGCTWTAATGVIATLNVVEVAADPVQPMRAYAVAVDFQGGSQTGLWKTEDRGKTWALHIPLAMQTPAGIAISADGQKVATTALGSTMPRTATLYEAAPTGMPQSRPLTLSVDGRPLLSVSPIRYEGSSLYLRTSTDAGFALHRLDGAVSMTPMRLLSIRVPIYELARAPQGNSLLVGTREGIYQQQADQSFKLLTTLSGSWCLSVQGSTLYSCASNYAPDLAAVAKLGPDLTTYTRAFRFSETKGPIDCPATTNTGKLCPAVWANYSDELADTPKMPVIPTADMSEAPPATDGCSYASGRPMSGAIPLGPIGALVGLGALAVLRRRRMQSSAARARSAR